MPIKTDFFVLRQLKWSDAKSLAKFLNNANVCRYLSTVPYPYKLNDAIEFLTRIIPQYKKPYHRRRDFVLGIEIDGQICGEIAFHKIKYGHKAEIGYSLAEKHWNKGIMKLAVDLFINHFAHKFELERIQADVCEDNEASIAVLNVNLFFEEGRLEKDFKIDQQFFDTIILARLDDRHFKL